MRVQPSDGRVGRRLANQAKAGFGRELGHQERSRDAFARHVAQHHRQAAAGEFDVIVIIAAQRAGGFVELEEIVLRQLRRFGGQEPPLHLVGDGQFAAHRLFAHRHVVHLRVLDGERRLACHAGQDVEVFPIEPLAPVGGVDLDRAQRFAFAGDQGRAHHRADMEIDDAFGHVEAGVRGRVGRENRLFRIHHAFDDRAADAEDFRLVRIPALDGLGNQPARFRILQDDEAAIGLDENFEEAVEQLGQDVVQLEGSAQVLADFQERLQLKLGIDLQAEAGRAGGEIHLRHHHRTGRGPFVIDHRGLVFGAAAGKRSGGQIRLGRTGVKNERQIADSDFIALFERLRPADQFPR